MQLSLQSDYALRILMALGASERQLSVDDVARPYRISRNHLAKVAQRLQAAGWIRSYRGRGGGMRLGQPPEEIVVGHVVRKFENLSAFVSCFPGGGGCVIDGLCGLKPALLGAIEAYLTYLDGLRLSDLMPDKAALHARLEKSLVAASVWRPRPRADQSRSPNLPRWRWRISAKRALRSTSVVSATEHLRVRSVVLSSP